MNYLLKSRSFRDGHGRSSAGFTLIEFLVAMAMFLVVGGSVFAMFANNAPYLNRQENLAGLNISMQNAVSQMQLDLANAGNGYFPGSVISSWPIGVTITNQHPWGAPACNDPTTFTYTAACFDTLNILTVNPNVPAAHPTDSSGDTSPSTCVINSIQSSPFYILPNAGQTPAQTAAGYNTGDEVILITTGGSTHTVAGPTSSTGNGVATSSGTLVNAFVLTGPPTVGPNYVALPFTPAGTNNYTNDGLSISTPDSTNLGGGFCASDWVMKLEPTTYTIDVSNPQDPKLVRQQNGNSDVIAEQIIGFKVGAATWNSNIDSSNLFYSFYAGNLPNATPPTPSGYSNNFQYVRSVRVTMVGRTNPNPDPTYTFRNTFDGGPYQVSDATVVIDPRNLTMNGN